MKEVKNKALAVHKISVLCMFFGGGLAIYEIFVMGNIGLGIVGALIAIVCLFVQSKSKKIANGVCDKCGGSMKGADFTYDVTDSPRQTYNKDLKQYFVVHDHKVYYNAVCPHCGATKSFNEVYLSDEDLNSAIRNDCNKWFRG